MAGVGIKLNRIFEKNTITTDLYGFGYCIVITIAPMLIVVLTIFLMMTFLGFSTIGYAARILYACTTLYMFIFALLTTAPFNAVLSKYMSDVIYEEKYEDIMPCFHLGLLINAAFSSLLAIPFCLWEFFVGQVDISYVFAGFCGYISLVFVFYTSLYMTIFKDYVKVTLFYLYGMLTTLLSSLVFVYVLGFEATYSMLISLALGFLIIGSLEYAKIKSYFPVSSKHYRRVLHYFRTYAVLIVTNFAYTLGLFAHNFVFWFTDINVVVAKSFVCAEPYDMASCLAMITNISASVIFISSVEMHFHARYRDYSEAVISGRWSDIEKTEKRMFQQLSIELMNLTRVQFIISIIVYLVLMVLLPQFGFSGMIMRIYPSLAAGYFVLFLMYAAMIFLYYFDDMKGAMLTSISFFVVTVAGAIFATRLSDIWYGIGLFAGAFAGWCTAYLRLRWVERNLDVHVFCKGELLKKGKGIKPPDKVYDIYQIKGNKRIQKKEE